MTLSIIIVSYNTSKLLFECINSIYLHVPKLSFEIIVVDNDSKDGTQMMLKEKYPTIKLIELNENVGFGSANNIGVQASKGEYILLLNSDVIIIENFIDELIEYLKANPNTGILGPKLLNCDMSLQYSCRNFPTLRDILYREIYINDYISPKFINNHWEMRKWSFDSIRTVDYICGAVMIMKKSLFEKIGGFDKIFFMYSEEVDLCLRLSNLGYSICYYPFKKVIHIGGGSSKEVKFNLEMYKSWALLRLKHFNSLYNTIYLLLILVIFLIKIFFNYFKILFNQSVNYNKINDYKRLLKLYSYYLRNIRSIKRNILLKAHGPSNK